MQKTGGKDLEADINRHMHVKAFAYAEVKGIQSK